MSAENGAPVVRRARAADQPAAEALWVALHREHEAMDPRYRLARDAALRWAADYRVWTRSDADRLLVADAGAAGLAGLAVAHLTWPPPVYTPRLLVWVDDLFVAPPWRGQGVGRALLEAVRAWGRAAGAAEVRAGVLAANLGARRFWEGEGGRDYAVTVTLPL